MPRYEYECQGCGERFTVVQKISELDQQEVPCPSCSDTDTIRIVHGGTGFVLKGDGWVGRDIRERNNRAKNSEKMDKKMRDHKGNLRVRRSTEQ